TKRFEISDNCGGIPRNVALEKAFRLGRPEGNHDELVETVGVYGIGMKRAIFKMGREARVFSQHDGDAFEVEINPTWLKDDQDWDLPIKDAHKKKSDGTTIVVQELHPSIGQQFNEKDSTFIDELIKLIGRLFAVIIEKGFEVYVNDRPVKPVEIKLLLN